MSQLVTSVANASRAYVQACQELQRQVERHLQRKASWAEVQDAVAVKDQAQRVLDACSLQRPARATRRPARRS